MATTQIKDGFNGGSDNQLKVNSDGSINVDITGGGGGSTNVDIHDSAGNSLTSTSGSLNVNVTDFPSVQPVSGTVAVSNFPATQPISGSVSVTNFPAVQPISATALPLPTGASTAALQSTIIANQTNGTQETQIVGTVPLPTGSATAANQLTEIANQTNGTQVTQVSTLPSIPAGSANIGSITNITGTVSLPTGAATSALQTNGNSSLTSILADLTNGTQITQVSVLPSIPAGTNAIGSVSVSNFPATQPVSGTVTVIQPTGTNLHTVVDSSALPTGASTSALQSNVQSAPGTPQTVALTIQGNASSVPVPISGTVTVTPSGEQNVNLNQVGGSAIAIGQQLSAASLPVVLPAAQITTLTPPTTVTVTQSTASALNATVVGTTAAGSGASTGLITVQGNASGTAIPISAASLPLPTGASTSALQTTGNTSLTSILANQTNGTQTTKISGAIPAGTNIIGHVDINDGAGNALTSTAVGSSRALDSNVVQNVLPLDVVVTGNVAAANATVTATSDGQAAWTVYLQANAAGWTSGTNIVFEQSVDGTNYFTAFGVQVNTDMGTPNNGISGPGPAAFQGSMSGILNFRVRVFAYNGPDSVAVTIRLGQGANTFSVRSSLATGTNTIGAINLQDGSGNLIGSYNGELNINQGVNTALSTGALSVGTSSVAARVGGANLANRKLLTLTPTNGTVYLGATSGVTTTTGTPIISGETATYAFGVGITPFLISAGTVDVRVMEGS